MPAPRCQGEAEPGPGGAPCFEIADSDEPFPEKLKKYARLAHERFESDRFVEFCAEHLPHVDEVTWEFFGMWTTMFLTMAVSILAAWALMQPLKGMVVGTQWALRMHGFGGHDD